MDTPARVYAIVHYEDLYVQPLLLSALRSRLSPQSLVLINDPSELPSPESKFLQWRQYESIDFDHLLHHTSSSVANSYVIRKALIRKHYLSTTVSHWLAKHPASLLRDHVACGVEFEVDYAEFLDDALVEAFELKESWARNDAIVDDAQRKEWWILKPGMSDRGHGIRLFSSEEELQSIFEQWDPPSDDEGEEGVANEQADVIDPERHGSGDGVIASQLRHFIAQPYIDPPLLLPPPHPSSERKFHIRTYVLAVGALQVFVYRPMLALFAGGKYVSPSASSSPNDNLHSHLTNTCLQDGKREGSVHSFWSLPLELTGAIGRDWQEQVYRRICSVVGELFEAAARSMSIHFQPQPNAFELFGLDFLVDCDGIPWLLEVNSFPDFAQTGDELQGLIRGLFEATVELGIKPFLGLSHDSLPLTMESVLNIDLGRQ